MPEIMIEQSQDIINYINMLNLPISPALQNHMVNMISGIVATEGNKTVSAIYGKLTCNRDRSTGSIIEYYLNRWDIEVSYRYHKTDSVWMNTRLSYSNPSSGSGV